MDPGNELPGYFRSVPPGQTRPHVGARGQLMDFLLMSHALPDRPSVLSHK
jgi:hypothetical protein